MRGKVAKRLRKQARDTAAVGAQGFVNEGTHAKGYSWLRRFETLADGTKKLVDTGIRMVGNPLQTHPLSVRGRVKILKKLYKAAR